MHESSRTWQWQSLAPVRADAESVFVPCSELPDAEVGDSVVLQGEGGQEVRTGEIVASSEGDDETFFRVRLAQD